MVFKCILCETNTCYYYDLCDNCEKVQHLMKIYGNEKVYSTLNSVLVRKTKAIEKQTSQAIEKDDNSEITISYDAEQDK